MKKEIKQIDKERGIMRITTLNERWYSEADATPATGLPTFLFWPSSTWVSGYYPKGIQFYKWLADHGWDEAEALKNAAGDKGSKVHYACSDIDLGEEIAIDAKYLNHSTGLMEELTIEEVDCIVSYIKFIEKYKPILLANELTSLGKVAKGKYGGTLDKIFAIPNSLAPQVRQIWIVDIKTGQNIWEEYKMQISSYSHMEIDYLKMGITEEEWKNRKLAILQVGYRKNQDRFKFTPVDDKFELFESVAYKTWQNENPDAKPKEMEYPLILKSEFRKVVKKEEPKENVKRNSKINPKRGGNS